MTRRITQKHLQALVDRLNVATGNPTLTYVQPENGGKCTAALGNIHLVHMTRYGWSLERITNELGATTNLVQGRHTAAHMYDIIDAMLVGIQMQKQRKD